MVEQESVGVMLEEYGRNKKNRNLEEHVDRIKRTIWRMEEMV